MEDEDNKPILKPFRSPDYVAHHGSAFWWHEMVYMNPHNVISRLILDNGELYVNRRYISRLNSDKPRIKMAIEVTAKYHEWWYETFEKHFFGEE